MNDKILAGQLNSEQKFVEVDGGKLSYEVMGDGPSVLCLPGMGDMRRVYERFAPALVKAGYRVITTDLRGNGQSIGKFASHNISDLTNDIGAILKAENIQQAYLAAGSISGASAGRYAIEHPEQVLGLILFSPVFYTASPLMMELMAAAIKLPKLGAVIWDGYFKKLYPKVPLEADYIVQAKANIRQKGAIKSLSDMARTRHLEDQTKQIKVPTLIFFGTVDPDFKDVNAEAARVQTDIPQAQIEILEGYGHYTQREASEIVIPKTLAWLASSK